MSGGIKGGLGVERAVEGFCDELSPDNPVANIWGIIEAIEEGQYEERTALISDLVATAELVETREDEILTLIQTELLGPYGPLEQIVQEIIDGSTGYQESVDEMAYEQAKWILSDHYEQVGAYCDQCGNYPEIEEELRRKFLAAQTEIEQLKREVRRQELTISELEIIARGAADERSR